MNAPCKDCPDRWVDTETFQTCHGTCEKYKAFKAWREEVNRKTHEQTREDYWHKKRIQRIRKTGGRK